MLLGLAGFVGLGLIGAAATERRQALWGVVELCVTDMRTTGFAFPCLAVDISQGEERGYIVLRPPVGAPDTILSPTRKTVGIEDPWLQSAEAPNYFALAWNVRRLAPGAEPWLDQPDAMGLAVNSRFARKQDQLHVHIGCMRNTTRLRLRALAPKLAVGVWTQAESVLLDHEAWVLRTGEGDVSHLLPFRLAAQRMSTLPWGDIAAITLGAAPVRIGGTTEFVLVAFPSTGLDPRREIAAEDLLEARCPTRGG